MVVTAKQRGTLSKVLIDLNSPDKHSPIILIDFQKYLKESCARKTTETTNHGKSYPES